MKRQRRRSIQRGGYAAGVLAAIVLISCGGEPIVARTPEALYSLAQQQIANGRFGSAADSLGKIIEGGQASPMVVRARVLQLALLGALARSAQVVGEAYREGQRNAGDAPHASRVRPMAMDYFGRARGYGTDLVEALDRMDRHPLEGPVRLDFEPPGFEATEVIFAGVRAGKWINDDERAAAEQELVKKWLYQTLRQLSGGREITAEYAYEPAPVYLAVARQILDLTPIFDPDALGDPRLNQIFHEKALGAARRAMVYAQDAQNFLWQQQSEEIEQRCLRVLRRP